MKHFHTLPRLILWLAIAPASATSYQDLWSNPAEPGWGVALSHQADTLFAALFTYDTLGKPMWLMMSNGAKTGEDSYAGELYRTTGPAFNAASYNASQVSVTRVGMARFLFADPYRGTLSYDVNGVTVNKSIVRQTYRSLPVAGRYHAGGSRKTSGCSDANLNGNSYYYNRDMELSVTGDTLSYKYLYYKADGSIGGSCSASGSHAQYGSRIFFSAPFSCDIGSAGQLTLSDMKFAETGFLGKIIWQYNATNTSNANCLSSDTVSAARVP